MAPQWVAVDLEEQAAGDVNLGHPEGSDILVEARRYRDTADVVIESFRPGTLEKW